LKKGTTVLDDNKSIANQKITEGTTLSVDYNVISITVRVLGQDKTVSVDPDDKVSSIKSKLSALGFEGGYHLVVGGVQLVETKTIAQAGIKSGTVVVVDYKEISITYKVQGKTGSISVDPDNKVQTIRDAIKEKEHMDTDKFSLKLGSIVLDVNKTIYASGIRAGSTIDIDYKKIEIFVKNPSGATETYEVDPDDLLTTLRAKIAAKLHIDATNFGLHKDGVELMREEKTIYGAGIRSGDTLTIDMYSFDIKVKLPNGQIITVSVDPAEKIV
jgi:hypothetical protein